MTHDSLMIRFAEGTGNNLGKAINRTLSWSQFKSIFSRPNRTSESFREYLKASEETQKTLKSVNGWFYRTQIEGKVRNRGSGKPSDLITLDFDYASPEFVEALKAHRVCPEFESFFHSTRRHTPEKPRLRAIIPVSKPIPNDLYQVVSRIIGKKFDPTMELLDKVSFRPAQMMFKPTCSRDSEYLFIANEGELVDWELELEIYAALHGDWNDLDNLPKTQGEELRVVAEKAEDPTEKTGPVGDFCRAYNVMEAIATFLPDKYEPVDIDTAKPRYTYLGGTTTNGAEVQDDGLFLYSHHGSDPCGDMLVNAYDLVRIHKFGDLDKDLEKGTKVTDRPSMKAMNDFIKQDKLYIKQMVKSRFDAEAMAADFDDEDVGGEVEIDEDYEDLGLSMVGPVDRVKDAKILGVELGKTPERAFDDPAPVKLKKAKKEPPKKDWIGDLEMTQNGQILSNAPNVTQILSNDIRLRDSIEFNEFTKRIVTRKSIRTKLYYVASFHIIDAVNGDLFEDFHMASIRVLLESPNGSGKVGYGLKSVADRDLKAGLTLHARGNQFHPVREYLNALEWDGVTRAETLFIDYLGCPDTPYYRQAARLWLLGAVTRIFEPGHKFDFVPILSGEQGIRKSTFFAMLAMDWFGELSTDFSDDQGMVESMAGRWILEIPELSAMTRSSVEDAKAFISRRHTQVRLPYAAWESIHLRQCVFAGTTNDDEYLIDRTGNRRFWPIKVMIDQIDTDHLGSVRNLIWAEMVVIYHEMRASQPHGQLPLYMTEAAIDEAKDLQEGARVQSEVDFYAEKITPYLDRKIDYDDNFDTHPSHRQGVTLSEIWSDALGNTNAPQGNASRQVGAAIRKAGWVPAGPRKNKDRTKTQKTFVPGPEILARWTEEDGKAAPGREPESDDDDDDLSLV